MVNGTQSGRTLDRVEAPRLSVELPSRAAVFFGNARDFIFPARLPDLELLSAPAPFWPDVFVERRLPWFSFLESGAYHIVAITILIAAVHFFGLHSPAMARAHFEHAQVVYYARTEYLPPLDTRTAAAREPEKTDPVYAPQAIISVPAEADNRTQTIVTPPSIKLKHDVAMPNIIAWSKTPAQPQLLIPPVPLTPVAEITRVAPALERRVVTPPPDASELARRRDQPELPTSVVAPPPDMRASSSAAVFNAPQPAVVAPPPTVNPGVRTLGELNIGPSAVIAPAPQLPLEAQRAAAGGSLSARVRMAPRVVPPPPTLAGAGSGSAGAGFGSVGRVIALSLHPAVGALTAVPNGNRRGTFAAGPRGRAAASGAPGSSPGTAVGNGASSGAGNGSGAGHTRAGDLPVGLYAGHVDGRTSAVAGSNSAPEGAATPAGSASAPPPRVSSVPVKAATLGSTAKLSDAERGVFGDRKFYSVTLNMPNLNSAGGSWVIRFAELNADDNSAKAALSQPNPTRKVDPGYPSQLMKENVSGTVILYAIIRADGTVGNVRVLRGVDDRLDRYARQAVSQWRFDPATKNGLPVDVEATFKIPFRPPRNIF
jgi:TonB family protein